MRVNLFFEGGGVLGIAYVGAYQALIDHNVEIDNCIGISAGSIISSLIIAGYTPGELEDIIKSTDLNRFKCKTTLSERSLLGKPMSLLLNKGIYDSCEIETWMDGLLQAKHIETFSDLMKDGTNRLHIIAADSTTRHILMLPEGLNHYNINPLHFSVAKAVRMSSAIPYFFTPVKLSTYNRVNNIVDGGVVKDVPLPFIKRYINSNAPIIRFKLKNKSKFNFLSLNQSKRQESHDVVIMSERNIRFINFNIDPNDIQYLYDEGYKRTEAYLRKLRTNPNIYQHYHNSSFK